MELSRLSNDLRSRSLEDSLRYIASLNPAKTIFTTSFGVEDQVITHAIFENDIPIDVVTLDTGRLFPETYKVFSETMKKYNRKIGVFFPDHADVERMVTEKGPYSFYHSKENRLECCRIRKVVPLARALEGRSCWISGIRAGQSPDRSNLDWLEYDENKKLYKFLPLFNWTLEEVNEYLKKNNVPVNALVDKGYVSIGCEPCTRAVSPGEDFRAGRWWWESGNQKECGLHLK